ncbi:MAG TPA: hypothetical protein VL985_09425 [Stellaceae bacterium]|nr:hypothetical protein [Stellaceae bacterium]
MSTNLSGGEYQGRKEGGHRASLTIDTFDGDEPRLAGAALARRRTHRRPDPAR